MKMSFNIVSVYDFLKSWNYVYTVRNYYDNKITIVEVDGIGKCERICIFHINGEKKLLEKYVKDSGFDNLEAWWTKIKMFKAEYGYLYNVLKLVEKRTV